VFGLGREIVEETKGYKFVLSPIPFGFKVVIRFDGKGVGLAKFQMCAGKRLYLNGVIIKPEHASGKAAGGFMPMLKALNMARRRGVQMGAKTFEFGYKGDSRKRFGNRIQGSFGQIKLKSNTNRQRK